MEDQAALNKKKFLEEKRQKAAKPLLWFGLVSIVMLFAGMTSAVIVRKGDGDWLQYEMPSMFSWSTVIILLSSVTFILALRAAKKEQKGSVKQFVLSTFVLGIIFVFMQFKGYQQLIDQGVYMTGAEHNASGSFLYIISGLHLAHLAGGLISLMVVLFNAFKGRYDSKNLLGLQLSSTYWHFLGGMWVYLYVFFRLII